jgi:energy-converting hydrogenase Eha subunit E
MSHSAEWLTLAGLGAYHGLNPAMGWLFAVSLGLQHGERRAVTRSFLPIAIGHELSVVIVAALVLGLGVVADPAVLHIGAAAVLIGFGLWRFARPRAHPRWTTMRVNRRELTLWSFLMSSAHGAGLMVAPVLLGGAAASASEGHDLAMASSSPVDVAAVGVALHLVAMVAVMATVALVVYTKVGVEILRRAWVNTDALWAGAFVLAGIITLLT